MWKKTKRRRQEFEAAALEHLDALYGVALRLTRDEQNAQDLVQDTYVRALRFYDNFEWGTNIRAWLLRIMTNTFINCYRRSQRERQLSEEAETSPMSTALMSNQALSQLHDPESHVLSSLVRHELTRAVDELAEDFRMPVVLADVYGFSYREIAEIQGCPIGTVMSRLHRGRKALQSRLLEQAQASGILKEASETKSARDQSTPPTDLNEYRRRRKVS